MTNEQIVAAALKKAGITNRYSVAAIMAIISKESAFVPQSEISYRKTDNSNIRATFEKTKTLTSAQLTKLKSNDVDFFNFVYGGRYGNSSTEGYKYRGRGFNQLTFKGNYITYGRLTNTDLVNNPDLANNVNVAAAIVAQYFLKNFADNQAIIERRYKAKNINDFKDTKTAVNAFYNANAGFRKDTSRTTTKGKTKALNIVDTFLAYGDFIDKNKTPIGLGALLIIGGIYFLKSKNLLL
jgi:predicted chitinase